MLLLLAPLDLLRTDIKMSYGADGSRSHRGHPNAASKKCCQHPLRIHGTVQFEDHDIGFDRTWIEHHPGQFGETFGEPPRIDMVFGEPTDVVSQREYAAGGDDPRLTHGPTHLLLEPPRLREEFKGTGKLTGAPSSLVKSIHAESNGFAYSPAATPLATTAFISRASSRCVRIPCCCATSVTA